MSGPLVVGQPHHRRLALRSLAPIRTPCRVAGVRRADDPREPWTTRMAEMNRQVLTNLDRMIAKLEADEDDDPQPPE
jgi:hypothetical protein